MQQQLFLRDAESAIPTSLADLAPPKAPPQMLVRTPQGLRQATPAEIVAAARDAIEKAMPADTTFNLPSAVKRFFLAKLGGAQREFIGVMYLNHTMHLIAYEEPFGGTLAQCAVYPRELVKRALEHNAAAVIVAHPHPSGTRQPSQADYQITRQLRDALALVDVRLVDHIIVAGTASISLAEQGAI